MIQIPVTFRTYASTLECGHLRCDAHIHVGSGRRDALCTIHPKPYHIRVTFRTYASALECG